MNLSKHTQSDLNKLKYDAGELVLSALESDDITEIMLNPDGILWFESRSLGMYPAGTMPAFQAKNFLHTIAGIQGLYITEDHPILETELPLDRSRFEGTLPPLTENPSFTIRKRAKSIFSLSDYLHRGIVNQKQVEVIQEAICARKNILICGGPGTGKTTLTNACIHELTKLCDPSQRIVILEDVPELQCAAKNVLSMCTSKNIDMSALLRITLRSRPDRILVGEVRDKAMLDLLKAWNTGCPGGIATVHANGTIAAIQRCCDLAMEANIPKPVSLICETVNVIVSIERDPKHPAGRLVRAVTELKGHKDQDFIFQHLATMET